MKKIDEQTEEKIFEDIKREVPYSVIAKRYGVGRATISRIKNRKDKNLEVEKPNKQTIGRRRKKRELAVQREIVKKAPLIVSGMLNVLQAIEYSVTNLVEIQEESQTESKKISEELIKLNENVEKYILDVDVNKNGVDVGKQKLINNITKAIAEAGNFYARETVRIKAIAELRGQAETFAKYEVMIKGLSHIREFIDNLFKAMNTLPDDVYKEYRNRVIELYPAGKDYFDFYETEVEDAEYNHGQKQ